MIVVDASIVVDVLLGSSTTEIIEPRLFESGRQLCAPHLLDIEAAHVFRRLAMSGEISPERGATMLALLSAMPLRRYAHTPLMPRVWELRANVTAYDAVYVALAETLGVPLLTRDRRLARAAGHIVAVEVP